MPDQNYSEPSLTDDTDHELLFKAAYALWLTEQSGDGGAGTVTSVGLTLPASLFTVTGSPVTTSGTLDGALATQTANTVFAGPTTGAAAAPTFRALVAADMVAAGSNTQVQFNNGGALGASTALTFSGTTLSVGVENSASGTLVLFDELGAASGRIVFHDNSSGFISELSVSALTGNVTVNLPDATGIIALNDNTATLTNKTIDGSNNTITNVAISTAVSGLGTGVATALAINVGTAGAPVVLNGALGTPSSGTLTNATGLPISTGVSGLGSGVATALSNNTGTGGAVVIFNGGLGTPTSGSLANCTGLPLTTGVTGDLPLANLAQASAASRLLGRGSAAGAGDYQEITLGAGLSMSGTALSVSGFATLDANTFTALQTITQASANAGIIASTGYSLTGSDATSMVNLAGTLNSTGVVDVFKLNVTNTASGAGSNLLNLQVGGTSKIAFGVDGVQTFNYTGDVFFLKAGSSGFGQLQVLWRTNDTYGVFRDANGNTCFRFGTGRCSVDGTLGFGSSNSADSPDTFLVRDAANIMAFKNGTNAQTCRIYGNATGSHYLNATHNGTNAILSVNGGGDLHISSLPTANPGPGILWNNAGTPAIGT